MLLYLFVVQVFWCFVANGKAKDSIPFGLFRVFKCQSETFSPFFSLFGIVCAEVCTHCAYCMCVFVNICRRSRRSFCLFITENITSVQCPYFQWDWGILARFKGFGCSSNNLFFCFKFQHRRNSALSSSIPLGQRFEF